MTRSSKGAHMFREIVRKKQELSREECLEILMNTKRGVLSVNGDEGYPYGVPINHYYDPVDGKIYFHGGKSGHKIDAMKKDDKVSFCVMDEGTPDPESWFLHFRSVIVFGRIEFIEDEKVITEKSRLLSYKFTEDEDYIDYEIEKSLKGTAMFALVPEHICGKHVREK